MLVISRRKGQRIAIGDDIELVVTAVTRTTVKLGIQAPRGVAVIRGEIRDAILDANRIAAESTLEHAVALAESGPPQGGQSALALSKLSPLRQSDDGNASQTDDGKAAAPTSDPRPSRPPRAQSEPAPVERDGTRAP